MTFFEHNRNIIFKKRSIDLVKARCQESNTSRQSSSQFLLQLCLLLKEVRVHLPWNIFLYIFKYTKIKIDSNVALHMHFTLTLSSAHVKKNAINHLFSSVSCFLFSSNIIVPKSNKLKNTKSKMNVYCINYSDLKHELRINLYSVKIK